MPETAGTPGSRWLVLGGILSFSAAALHIACILGGADWYRLVGAGEEIARAVESGALWPHVMTAVIAAVLAVWGLYGLSGGGSVPRLPFLRTALIGITTIYLARALLFIPLHLRNPHLTEPVMVWSSAIVMIYGLVHLTGLVLAWRHLSPSPARTR